MSGEVHSFVTLDQVEQHWRECALCTANLTCYVGEAILDAYAVGAAQRIAPEPLPQRPRQ